MKNVNGTVYFSEQVLNVKLGMFIINSSKGKGGKKRYLSFLGSASF